MASFILEADFWGSHKMFKKTHTEVNSGMVQIRIHVGVNNEIFKFHPPKCSTKVCLVTWTIQYLSVKREY